MIIVKTDLSGDLRRFSLDAEPTFESLTALLGQLYPVDIDKYRLKWKDDEGDWLVITCTQELREAVRLTQTLAAPILRILLEAKPSFSFPTSKSVGLAPSPVVIPSDQPAQTIRIQGKPFVGSEPVANFSFGVTKLPPKEEQIPVVKSVKEEEKVPMVETPMTTSTEKALPKKRFGRVISELSDDTARLNEESSASVEKAQADLGASTAAACREFADSIKDFYSSLINETVAVPGTAALEAALDSLCLETAHHCEKLQQDLAVQASQQLETVRSVLQSQDQTGSLELEEILQQSIAEAHNLASGVLQKTREQSISFLDVMNKLHQDTVSSVLKDAGAGTP